jgi:hypothetical protein
MKMPRIFSLREYRRRRAIRLAHEGIVILQAALTSPDITRAQRRRILSEIEHGKLDPCVLIGDKKEGSV